MSKKVSYAYNIIHPVINEFSPNFESSHFHICDHLIVKFGIREKCLVFSNTSHVESLYRFRKSVVDNVITYICIIKNITEYDDGNYL